MSKRIIYLLLVLSLGINAGMIATTLIHRKAPAPLGPRGGPRENAGRPGPPADPARLVDDHLRGMAEHLALDAEQQEAIRDILDQHMQELVRLQDDAAVAAQRLSKAYSSPSFDPEGFRQMAAEVNLARAKVDSLSAAMLIAEAAVLNEEQRRKFAQVAPTIQNNPNRPPGKGGPPAPR